MLMYDGVNTQGKEQKAKYLVMNYGLIKREASVLFIHGTYAGRKRHIPYFL